MKKVLVLVLGLILSIALVGCNNDPLANAEKDYYGTGQFNGWDTVTEGKMVAIAKNDERVSSIKGELRGVEYLYLLDITLSAEDAGWGVTYKIDSVETVFNGNLTVKFIRTAIDDPDTRDWWAPDPASGEIVNLTPDTLYIPPFMEENVDGAGTWVDNPVALVAGHYYFVVAEFDGSRAMGLVTAPVV